MYDFWIRYKGLTRQFQTIFNIKYKKLRKNNKVKKGKLQTYQQTNYVNVKKIGKWEYYGYLGKINV